MTSALTLSARTFASLKSQRNYRLFFIGQMISLSGTWMGDTAIPWLVVQRTHSPVAVGVLLCCRYAPIALFGLFAGVLADRFDNRRFLIATQFASMVVIGILAALTFLDATPLWVIYAFGFLSGSALVFDVPARNALTFQLVGREQLSNAVALMSGLNNAARIVAPAVAGIVIAVVGVGTCFAINATSFLAVITVLCLMRREDLFPLERDASRPKAVRAICEGIAYVRSEPLLRLAIIMTALVTLTGFNYRIVLPLLASETVSVGAATFGILYALFGLGAVSGALFAAATSMTRWKVLLVGVGSFSVAMLVLAPLHSVWPVAVALFVIGMGFSMWAAATQAIMQLTAPGRLQGRVVSLWIFVWGALTPLGSLLSGWLASIGGTQLPFSIGGAVGLVVTGVAIARTRSMRLTSLREHRDPPEEVVDSPEL